MLPNTGDEVRDAWTTFAFALLGGQLVEVMGDADLKGLDRRISSTPPSAVDR